MRSFNPRSAAPVQDNTGKASTPIAQNDSQLNSDPTDQSATNRKIGKDSASLQKVPRRVTVATWVVRLCFAFVFVVNVQCALGFALAPEAYMGAYELGRRAGARGHPGHRHRLPHVELHLPSVIWRPERHRALASVVLAQQVVGLVGESLIPRHPARRPRPAGQQRRHRSSPSTRAALRPDELPRGAFFCFRSKSAHALGSTPRRSALPAEDRIFRVVSTLEEAAFLTPLPLALPAQGPRESYVIRYFGAIVSAGAAAERTSREH